jgi:hypothetical protein
VRKQALPPSSRRGLKQRHHNTPFVTTSLPFPLEDYFINALTRSPMASAQIW